MNKEKHDYREAQEAQCAFGGYAPPTSSTTYTPNQFFDVVLPRASRGCLRLVAYLVRKTLGWSDEHGNPQNPEATVSYRELIENAGIGRGRVKESIEEAIESRYINCLRFGQPHRAGEEGFSALYSLRWDESEVYVTDPEKFDGFFAGNGNLTHIPNDFFDYTIPNESLALVKVVGVIIRHTIGFQTKFGFRRQQVEMSFSEIMRRTGIASRSTVNIALKEGIEKNHIRKVSEGFFDPKAGVNSSATTYGVKWIDQGESLPKGSVSEFKTDNGSKIEPEDRFQNRTGEMATVPKSNRGNGSGIVPEIGSKIEPATVPESNREGFQNRTDIKTTDLNNRSKQQQQRGRAVAVGGQEMLSARILLDAGFDFEAAAAIAARFPTDRIQRQIDWLPLRNVKRNQLGLLRKAIEEDWQEPESPGVQTSERNPRGNEFGANFFAALAGRSGEPTVAPSAKEAEEAEAFLKRASKALGSMSAAEAGRRFGSHVRRNQDEKRSPVRGLSFALRTFGDGFVSAIEDQLKKERRERLDTARKNHEVAFSEAFSAFGATLLETYSREHPEVVQCFDEANNNRISRVRKMSAKLAVTLENRLADPTEKAKMFTEYLKESGKHPVLNFWEWDELHNPTPFIPEEQSL